MQLFLISLLIQNIHSKGGATLLQSEVSLIKSSAALRYYRVGQELYKEGQVIYYKVGQLLL